jgi:hypothetical protein
MKNKKLNEKEIFNLVADELIHRVNFIKHIAETIENSPHRKNGKAEAVEYRRTLGKMMNQYGNELMLAQMFGVGNVKGAVDVVDVEKLKKTGDLKSSIIDTRKKS